MKSLRERMWGFAKKKENEKLSKTITKLEEQQRELAAVNNSLSAKLTEITHCSDQLCCALNKSEENCQSLQKAFASQMHFADKFCVFTQKVHCLLTESTALKSTLRAREEALARLTTGEARLREELARLSKKLKTAEDDIDFYRSRLAGYEAEN